LDMGKNCVTEETLQMTEFTAILYFI